MPVRLIRKCEECRTFFEPSSVERVCPDCSEDDPEGPERNPMLIEVSRDEGKDDEEEEEEDEPEFKLNYGPNWPEIRKEILERDNHQCVNCSLTNEEHIERDDIFPPNGGLHVHHITPLSTFDSFEEAHDPDNLVTLCGVCHRKATRGDLTFDRDVS